ncbi:MAG: 2-polyprenyl-3-methyl-6-methoxy-1,4-benzoquinone monooxygenase [Polynucleobacter sp.]|nr:2-polyprenyl-3-methyl-6-methoxy-1,4-benzoquinone monooxygenase [Polynucleobacter sp.]
MSLNYSVADQVIREFDIALRSVFGGANSHRSNPADQLNKAKGNKQVLTSEAVMSTQEQDHAAGLMRVNHVGEVCAQALYQAQKLVARDPQTKELLSRAASEEMDHMAWCEERLKELNSHPSFLNPIWYGASFAMGLLAGLSGDKWSLGFLAETEKQVEKHLESHLEKLPQADDRSRAIVEQMRQDEIEHGSAAIQAGGEVLPQSIQTLMSQISRLMTTTAYKI